MRQAYVEFDYKRIFAALNPFMTVDLSAFYFDIRKDALYCDPVSSATRKAALTVIDELFRCTVTWLAPMLCFTAEEAWLSRYPGEENSVHLELFPEIPASYRDEALAEKWRKVRTVRRAVTGALEVERANKRIGSSLEAAPVVYVSDADLFAALVEIDLAEMCITSAATLVEGEGPAEAFRLDEVKGVAVVPKLAEGRKCARSWKISTAVGSDPDYPDVTPRDAQALREWDAMPKAAERRRSDVARYLYGPLTRLGLIAAAIACALDQAVKLWLLVPLRPGQQRLRPPHVVPRLRAHLESGHQLRPVPAGHAISAATRCSRSRPARWSILWVWLARAETQADRALARPDHRRGVRQRHRPPRLWGGDGLRPVPHRHGQLQIRLVRVQRGGCRHRCGGDRAVV